MTQDELINLLAEKEGVSPSVTGLMVKTVAECIADNCRRMDAVAIPGFGTFQPQKSDERIVVDKSGARTLLPPEISLLFRSSVLLRKKTFRMNEKIPIKVLSEQVASRVNIESSDAQDAIKSIFALIADVLKEGKSVTINGLGTFSPDVNPLEPVAFMPDPELADELNAPFSMFEPERLSDSVSEADLNNIGMPEQQPVDSTVSATKVETQSAPSVKVENVPTPEPVKENSGWGVLSCR